MNRRLQTDLEFVEHARTLIAQSGKLDELMANASENKLLTALARIEDAARKAQWRVIDSAR